MSQIGSKREQTQIVDLMKGESHEHPMKGPLLRPACKYVHTVFVDRLERTPPPDRSFAQLSDHSGLASSNPPSKTLNPESINPGGGAHLHTAVRLFVCICAPHKPRSLKNILSNSLGGCGRPGSSVSYFFTDFSKQYGLTPAYIPSPEQHII